MHCKSYIISKLNLNNRVDCSHLRRKFIKLDEITDICTAVLYKARSCIKNHLKCLFTVKEWEYNSSASYEYII